MPLYVDDALLLLVYLRINKGKWSGSTTEVGNRSEVKEYVEYFLKTALTCGSSEKRVRNV